MQWREGECAQKFFKQRRLDEVVSLSPIVAGQEPDSAISWENSEITAFRCDIVDLTGPVQVLHEEPVDQNNVQVAFYEFGAEIQGSYRLDDYDPTINEIIRDNGLVQPSRVNAVSSFFFAVVGGCDLLCGE